MMVSIGRNVIAGLLLLLMASIAAGQSCTGDCDNGATVTVDEVVTGVNIALGARPLSECIQFDSDGSETVTVDELIQALNYALAGCPVEAPTSTPTPTATVTATPTQGATGPVITYFGLATASGFEMQIAAMSDEGIPIYQLSNPLGAGILIVVEAKARTSANEDIIGNVTSRSDPFLPIKPDLQLQSDRNLGNGSAEICDLRSNPPDEMPGGGVPGTLSLDPESQTVANAMNDVGCRFEFNLSNQPCTKSPSDNFRFLRTDSQGQFCTLGPVAAYWGFPTGDTTLAVRWADVSGKVSEQRRIIVRTPE